MKAAIVA